MKTIYWITTDTHFGHDKIIQWLNRPTNHEELIMKNLRNYVKEKDILIHLGDISWKEHTIWNKAIIDIPTKRKYLIRGNHDKNTLTWYLNQGWDFVGDSFTLNIFGKIITFSHKPLIDNGYDFNIHGHFHNSEHRKHEPELVAIKNNKQILVMLEHKYMPINLQKIIS